MICAFILNFNHLYNHHIMLSNTTYLYAMTSKGYLTFAVKRLSN